ncbi:MAG: hypothetical protein OEY33_07345 [Bdellovibrionales bacterium]|nr:hypothetical protein [Bdellovibrionales bacterium]
MRILFSLSKIANHVALIMMETQNNALRPILKDVPIFPKQCPECRSFFVEDKKCEDCGADFSIRHILSPDDDKSYYNLMNEYYYEKRRFQIFNILLFPEVKFKAYIKLHKKLIWRLKDILKFLDTSYRLTKKERFLIVQEAKQIIIEKQGDKIFSKELESLKQAYKGPKTRDCFESIPLALKPRGIDKKWVFTFIAFVIILGMGSNLFIDISFFSNILFGR